MAVGFFPFNQHFVMVKWRAKGEMAKKNKRMKRLHSTQMQMLKKAHTTT